MAEILNVFEGGKLFAGRTAARDSQTLTALADVSTEVDGVDAVSTGSTSVDFLVDYSDFANFVTFNSAESYVTITADRILNNYPADGDPGAVETFWNESDGYQRYFLDNWPSRIGNLQFNPASGSAYVRFDDLGMTDGVARSSFMSPGTSSFSVSGWLHTPALTGSDDVMVLFQKLSTAGDGYTVYLSGSSIRFKVVSGSTSAEVSGALTTKPAFFSSVCDRGAGLASIFIGTTGTFPTVADSASLSLGARFDLGSGSFYIGSGTLSSKVVVRFTGTIDDVAVWSSARVSSKLTSSYNRKIYAQSELIAGWRFNECLPATSQPIATIVKDCSGHRLDGRIQSYYSQIRGSGSFAFDIPDPILTLDEPTVLSYVVGAQGSGSDYDRSNESLIFNLFPSAFFDTDDHDVFKTLTLSMARHFDRIKLAIDQLVETYRVRYSDFDQSPDSLLDEVGRFFGLSDAGVFSDVDALRYFYGRGVAAGPVGNYDADTTMAEIKSAFMRRALQNMMHLYKFRGTRESVESLMRIRGVDPKIFRLKEYAYRTDARLPVTRVASHKSVYALRFSSGSKVSYTAP